MNKTTFEAKYNNASTGLYKDNTTKDIVPSRIRSEVTDVAANVPFTDDDSYSWASPLVSSSGTNTYTATLVPAISSYVTGQVFKVKITLASTGASTLNLNGVGAKPILRNATIQAGARDLIINTIYVLVYDSSLDFGNGAFVMTMIDHWKGPWNWAANFNSFPLSTMDGDMFRTTDIYDDGTDFLDAGTLLIATTNGASAWADYLKK